MRRKKSRVARKKRSWEQDSAYDGLDLPGQDFDYEDFVEKEFGGQSRQSAGLAWYWWLTAVLLLALMAFIAFGG